MDSTLLRQAFSRFATGITVVTTRNTQSAAFGVTINSFSSLSLVPPLVQFNLKKESYLRKLIDNYGYFGVNVLNSDQSHLSERFSLFEKSTEMNDISLQESPRNLPIFLDALAAYECRFARDYEGGDHMIMIGEVEKLHLGQGNPLLFYGSHYSRLEKIE